MKKVTILGSTGSIGTQALSIIQNTDAYSVLALAAGKNISLLEEQIRMFRPKFTAVYDEAAAAKLRKNVQDTDTTVLGGLDGVRQVAAAGADITVTAMVGSIGSIT